LGLSVVEALAGRWGGSVRLEDRPEGGTRCEVRLPPIVEHVEVTR
jgi:signal transduction histidine kinase